MNESDEILLLQLIREGDQTAFRYLFYKYVDGLERFVCCLIRDREAAQEIVLDLFTYVWENRATIQIQLTWKAYLFQSARNRALTYLRDNRTPVYLEEVQWSEQSVEDASAMELAELHRLIQEAVCHLPAKCQQIFRMSRQQGLSNRQIAQELNLSEKTIEGQMTIALRKIRAFLGKSYSYLW